MLIKFLILAIGMFATGALFMWIWLHGDVIRYKELYEKVVEEKKNLQIEYNHRLDILSKALDTDTSYMNFGMLDLELGAGGPPTASGEVLDNEYR